MEKGLKYGLLATAAALGIYSIIKANQEEEEVAALPAAQTPATLEPVVSYGEWREIKQDIHTDFWNLYSPPEVPGKTLVNLFIQVKDETVGKSIGAVPYYFNGNYGMILSVMDYLLPYTNLYRIVAIYI